MAGSVGRICDAVDRVSEACARIGGFLTLLMMLSVLADALLRSFANIALLGVAELNAFLMVAMVFVGLAGTQASRANFRVAILAEALDRRIGPPLPGALLLLQFAALGVLTWFCLNGLVFSYRQEEVTYGMVQVPVWPGRAVLVFGLVLLLVQTAADAARFLSRRRHPFEAPAVPDPEHDLR